MLQVNQLVGFGGGGGPFARAVTFDGANDWMLRGGGMTGAADGKQFLVSAWLRPSGDGTGRYIFSGAQSGLNQFTLRHGAPNKFVVTGRNAAGTSILSLSSNTAYLAGVWYHVLMAGDLAAGVGQVYVNDISDPASGSTLTNDTINYTLDDWIVGAETVAGALKANHDIAELYINIATTLDISVEANRRKFIGPDLKPAELGGNGQIPTGTAPIVYLRGPASAFPTNLGGGGNFTVTGALTDAATSPS